MTARVVPLARRSALGEPRPIGWLVAKDQHAGGIAVRPDQVVVLDFETRFPSPVTALEKA